MENAVQTRGEEGRKASGLNTSERPATGEANSPKGRLNGGLGERRLHLAALNAAVAQSGERLSCGLVSRAGGPPVLFVVSHTDKFRTLDVGCERVGGVWWFVRADTGEGLVRVLEVEDAPALLARLVERSADGAAGAAGTGGDR